MVLFGIVMFACNKEKPDSRLIGTWRIAKVTFRKDFAVTKTDLTDVYNDIRLTFYNDKTFLYHHPGRKIDLTGNWEMDEESQNNGETTTTVQYIDWWGEDHLGHYEEGKWDNISFNKNGMRATESKHSGTYNLRLVKE